jgi:hypothetical protein
MVASARPLLLRGGVGAGAGVLLSQSLNPATRARAVASRCASMPSVRCVAAAFSSITGQAVVRSSCKSLSCSCSGCVSLVPRIARSNCSRNVVVAKRSYSAGPERPEKSEIENRVLQVLKDFDKVDAAKVRMVYFYMCRCVMIMGMIIRETRGLYKSVGFRRFGSIISHDINPCSMSPRMLNVEHDILIASS